MRLDDLFPRFKTLREGMRTGSPDSRTELIKVLDKYTEVIEADDRRDVLKAYTLDKPISSIEIHLGYDKKFSERDVTQLIDELRRFFFVGVRRGKRVSGFYLIFVSRFKSLPKVALEYDLPDHPDLGGVLYGYPLHEVAEYCKEYRPVLFH